MPRSYPPDFALGRCVVQPDEPLTFGTPAVNLLNASSACLRVLPEIRRCLNRYLARYLYRHLNSAITTKPTASASAGPKDQPCLTAKGPFTEKG